MLVYVHLVLLGTMLLLKVKSVVLDVIMDTIHRLRVVLLVNHVCLENTLHLWAPQFAVNVQVAKSVHLKQLPSVLLVVLDVTASMESLRVVHVLLDFIVLQELPNVANVCRVNSLMVMVIMPVKAVMLAPGLVLLLLPVLIVHLVPLVLVVVPFALNVKRVLMHLLPPHNVTHVPQDIIAL